MSAMMPPTDPSQRRRTIRACDHCRRRKTRCDSEDHCMSCSMIGLQCQYSNRAKPTTGPRYIAHLEHKVEGLEARLRSLSSAGDDSDRSDSQSSDKSLSRRTPSMPTLTHVDSPLSIGSERHYLPESMNVPLPGVLRDELVDTIWLDNEHDFPEGMPMYRGRTTGVEVTQGLRRLCDTFVGLSVTPDRNAMGVVTALDSDAPLGELPIVNVASSFFPTEGMMRRWIDLALNEGFVLWHFIDRERLDAYVKRLVDCGFPDQRGLDDDQFGLLHSLIAIGQRHDVSLVDREGKPSDSAETRGLRHFAAARELVPLAHCGRSIAAVQTLMCMAVYLKSVSALRAVHTYVSTACHAAYQLGLHEASDAFWLPPKERAVWQRMYISLRIMDSYVTSSLGLPRNLKIKGSTGSNSDATDIASLEMLTAADANVELLDILSDTRDEMFFNDDKTSGSGSNMISAGRLDEVSRTFSGWILKWSAFYLVTDENASSCTKANMFLRYSYCFATLILYCPFLHHILKPEQRSSSGNRAASNCLEAAFEAICIADVMRARGMLCEAYLLTVDTLAMAATSLLVVELGAPGDPSAVRAKSSGRKAKSLFEILAWQNSAAARCLESLIPLYKYADEMTAALASAADQLMQDPTFAPKQSTGLPAWNFDFADLPNQHTSDQNSLDPMSVDPLDNVFGGFDHLQ